MLGVFLLVQPAGHMVWHRVVALRFHGGYDSHGDLLPDLLDYLETTVPESARAPIAKKADGR